MHPTRRDKRAIHKEIKDELLDPVIRSVEFLQTGGFEKLHWNMTTNLFNIGRSLAEWGIARNLQCYIDDAIKAMWAIRWRMERGMTFATVGELESIERGFDVLVIQIDFATMTELRHAVMDADIQQKGDNALYEY